MKMLVNIDVPELEPAIKFYNAALGLKHERTLDDDVAEMSGASSTIYLLKQTPGSDSNPSVTDTRRYSRHWTPLHIDFVVDDLEQAKKRALRAGAKQESKCVEWRGSRCVSFSDPFGHGFCFIEFSGQGYS